MEPLAVAAISPEKQKAAIERQKKVDAIRGFEEMFLNEMMKSMRKTVPETEESSQAKSLWRERFDAEIAHRIAEKGGIGLSRMLEQRLDAAEMTKPTVRP
jgi:flagellar protein FlgJ